MPRYKYHGENHDWDLVLRASNVMLQSAKHFRAKKEIAFSSQIASMILAFTAVESFTASMAFKLSQNTDSGITFNQFSALRGFWAKINIVCRAAGIDSTSGDYPFSQIAEMQKWRNNLVHASPYAVAETEIEDTVEVHALHASFHDLEAARFVSEDTADTYWQAAQAYVELLEAKTGIKPQSFAGYKIV